MGKSKFCLSQWSIHSDPNDLINIIRLQFDEIKNNAVFMIWIKGPFAFKLSQLYYGRKNNLHILTS